MFSLDCRGIHAGDTGLLCMGLFSIFWFGANQRPAKEKPRLAAGPFLLSLNSAPELAVAVATTLLVRVLALTVRVLLLLAGLLAAALLLLAGFLSRVLILLARILVLVGHRDLPCCR
jgi:hypothetical protein